MVAHGIGRRNLTYPVTPRSYSWWSSGRGGRREPLMGEHEPLGQQPRRLIRRLTVKRHHGGWHAGSPSQLRPPPVADRRDLDVVRTAANGFFEAMNVHVCDVRVVGSERRFYASRPRDQAKRGAKGASTSGRSRDRAEHAKEKFSLSGSPQVLHESSTTFPQRRPVTGRPTRT